MLVVDDHGVRFATATVLNLAGESQHGKPIPDGHVSVVCLEVTQHGRSKGTGALGC